MPRLSEHAVSQMLSTMSSPCWQVSAGCLELLWRALEADPNRRISLVGLLAHPWVQFDLPSELAAVNSRLLADAAPMLAPKQQRGPAPPSLAFQAAPLSLQALLAVPVAGALRQQFGMPLPAARVAKSEQQPAPAAVGTEPAEATATGPPAPVASVGAGSLQALQPEAAKAQPSQAHGGVGLVAPVDSPTEPLALLESQPPSPQPMHVQAEAAQLPEPADAAQLDPAAPPADESHTPRAAELAAGPELVEPTPMSPGLQLLLATPRVGALRQRFGVATPPRDPLLRPVVEASPPGSPAAPPAAGSLRQRFGTLAPQLQPQPAQVGWPESPLAVALSEKATEKAAAAAGGGGGNASSGPQQLFLQAQLLIQAQRREDPAPAKVPLLGSPTYSLVSRTASASSAASSELPVNESYARFSNDSAYARGLRLAADRAGGACKAAVPVAAPASAASAPRCGVPPLQLHLLRHSPSGKTANAAASLQRKPLMVALPANAQAAAVPEGQQPPSCEPPSPATPPQTTPHQPQGAARNAGAQPRPQQAQEAQPLQPPLPAAISTPAEPTPATIVAAPARPLGPCDSLTTAKLVGLVAECAAAARLHRPAADRQDMACCSSPQRQARAQEHSRRLHTAYMEMAGSRTAVGWVLQCQMPADHPAHPMICSVNCPRDMPESVSVHHALSKPLRSASGRSRQLLLEMQWLSLP